MKRVKVQRGYLSRMPAKRVKYYDQSFADVINPPRTALIQKYGKKRDLQNLLQLITSLKSLDKYEPSLSEKWKAKWKNLKTGNRSKIPGDEYDRDRSEINADEDVRQSTDDSADKDRGKLLLNGLRYRRSKDGHFKLLTTGEKDEKPLMVIGDDGDDDYDDPSEQTYSSSDEEMQKMYPPSVERARKIADAKKKQITSERNLEAMEQDRKEQEQRDLNDLLKGYEDLRKIFVETKLGTSSEFDELPFLRKLAFEQFVSDNSRLLETLNKYKNGENTLGNIISFGFLRDSIHDSFKQYENGFMKTAEMAAKLNSTLNGPAQTVIEVQPLPQRLLSAPISANMPTLAAPIVPSLPSL